MLVVGYEWHRPLEGRWIRFSLLTSLAVTVGAVCLLVPPFFLQGTIEPIVGLRPYSALELEGRDLYIREGCNTCHSQQVRPFKTETDRYGRFSMAGEGIYDRPFLWGSRRTGPDLARVGGKYPDSWHWLHFQAPRNLEPRSNMPAFAFLLDAPLDTSLTSARLRTLSRLGHPYSEAEIENGPADALRAAAEIAASIRRDGIELGDVQARSEAIAVIAYLQSLGRAVAGASVALGGARAPLGAGAR
jgi:cytochrome c oxidase cbb3-type subunit I/II